MTAVDESKQTTPRRSATGRVVRVIGPVVDVEFARNTIPELNQALTTEIELGELSKTLTLEVSQHIGDDMVRAIALQPTDGLVRGVPVTDTGSPATGPVRQLTPRPAVKPLAHPLA